MSDKSFTKLLKLTRLRLWKKYLFGDECEQKSSKIFILGLNSVDSSINEPYRECFEVHIQGKGLDQSQLGPWHGLHSLKDAWKNKLDYSVHCAE